MSLASHWLVLNIFWTKYCANTGLSITCDKVIALYFIIICIDCTGLHFFNHFFTCVHKNTMFETDKKRIPRNL